MVILLNISSCEGHQDFHPEGHYLDKRPPLPHPIEGQQHLVPQQQQSPAAVVRYAWDLKLGLLTTFPIVLWSFSTNSGSFSTISWQRHLFKLPMGKLSFVQRHAKGISCVWG